MGGYISGGTAEPEAPVPKFQMKAETQEEEDAFDLFHERNVAKPCGVTGSTANMIKGALGAGVLSGHVSYMKAGVAAALGTHILASFYICYCIHVLVQSAQILYRRTKVPYMTYPDVGEAAMNCTQSPCLMRWSKCLRYSIDIVICIDLFGSCACYQLIIAKSIKQLVENDITISTEPQIPGYPGIKVYVAAILLPCVMICLLRHLQWLAPVSIIANFFIALCIGLTVYYGITMNPSFSGLTKFKDIRGFLEYLGMMIFSMSCSGVAIPVENNMKDPRRFPVALFFTYIGIVAATILISLFGYVAFKENCHSPITVNFPMEILPKILKVGIVFMIFATHALNYWVPFQLCFHYLKNLHSERTVLYWEYFYRALFVLIIGVVAIVFPSIEALMGFLGTFCLSNMTLIWPHLIQLLVVYRRPGLGYMKWRLWRAMFFILLGFCIFVAGTFVNALALYGTASGKKLSEEYDEHFYLPINK